MAASVFFFTSCAAPEPSVDELPVPPASTAGASSTAEGSAAAAPATGPAVPSPIPRVAPLAPEGWGPIRIGMTRAEVVAAAGEDANPGAIGGADPEQCDQFRPERAPEGMLVMIERDRLTRISLGRGATIRTERGFGVGDAAGPIEAAYGADAAITPHEYVDAPGRYITVWTTTPGGSDARGLVYVIGQEGRVTHVHAGGSSIQYVEGCL